MPAEIILKLKPAELQALAACVDNELWAAREHGLGPDELPRYYARLERIQRLSTRWRAAVAR